MEKFVRGRLTVCFTSTFAGFISGMSNIIAAMPTRPVQGSGVFGGRRVSSRLRRLRLRWCGALILNDERDPAIAAICGMRRVPETLIGKTTNLRDLIGAHAVFLHPAPGGVGAIGGKLPIRVPNG